MTVKPQPLAGDQSPVDPKPLLNGDESPAAQPPVPTWRIMAVLFGVAFCSNFTTALIAPVLPWHLADMGASQIWSGLIFSIFPMATLLMTPLAKMAIGRYGRIPLLFWGLIMQCASTFSFGFADDLTGGVGVQPGAELAVFALSRFICGAGMASSNVSIFAIVVEHFSQGPKNRIGEVSGWNQVAVGVGFTLAPPLGNFLYVSGGFHWPFSLAAAMNLAVAPLALMLWQPRAGGQNGSTGARRQTRLLDVLKLGLVIPGFCVVLGTFIFGLVQPVLGPYLLDHVGLGPEGVGLIFGLYAAGFSLSAPMAGRVADRLGPSKVCAVGTLVAGLVLALLLGPTAGLFEKGSLVRKAYELGSFLTLGFMQACMIIPTLSAMRRGLGPEVLREPGVEDCISAWFVIFMNLGLGVGPLIGGAVMTRLSFESAMLACGLVIAVYGVAALALDVGEANLTPMTPVNRRHSLGSLRQLTLFPSSPMSHAISRLLSFRSPPTA